MAHNKDTVYISVDEQVSMVDTPIRISIHNLKPWQKVTFVAEIQEQSSRYTSYAHFISSHNGTVKIQDDPSLGGTYKGVDGMGFIWSMQPSEPDDLQFMPFKIKADTPHIGCVTDFIEVKAFAYITDVTLCKETIERWYISSDTIRTEVKLCGGNVHGVMFTPKGDETRAGIIDLHGVSRTGLVEHVAALLASYGYTCLALWYFEDQLGSTLIDYGHLDEAVQYMLNHPWVDSKQDIAVLGRSKGAELALHMASYNPRIKVCISVCGPTAYIFSGVRYNGKVLDSNTLEFYRSVITPEGIRLRFDVSDTTQTQLIPIEKSNAHFLLIHGCDDDVIHVNHTWNLADRIHKSGNNKCILCIYPGAGHYMGPPYTPLCSSIRSYSRVVLFGGDTRLHAIAKQKSWKAILECLSFHFENSYKRVGRK